MYTYICIHIYIYSHEYVYRNIYIYILRAKGSGSNNGQVHGCIDARIYSGAACKEWCRILEVYHTIYQDLQYRQDSSVSPHCSRQSQSRRLATASIVSHGTPGFQLYISESSSASCTVSSLLFFQTLNGAYRFSKGIGKQSERPFVECLSISSREPLEGKAQPSSSVN